MNHFAFSLLDLLAFAFYAAWFVFLVWFVIRLVRALSAIEDIGRSLRAMSYDLREINEHVRLIREKDEKGDEPRND